MARCIELNENHVCKVHGVEPYQVKRIIEKSNISHSGSVYSSREGFNTGFGALSQINLCANCPMFEAKEITDGE
jgi:hypothetical protein